MTRAKFRRDLYVLEAQREASKRGALCMWTIYDRPTDYPQGFIARRHEVPGGPTDDTFTGRLGELRAIFRTAGLTVLPRDEGDERAIVETWT